MVIILHTLLNFVSRSKYEPLPFLYQRKPGQENDEAGQKLTPRV